MKVIALTEYFFFLDLHVYLLKLLYKNKVIPIRTWDQLKGNISDSEGNTFIADEKQRHLERKTSAVKKELYFIICNVMWLSF